MKTNKSNETTSKVMSIQIMALTDTKNKNLGWSKKIYILSLHVLSIDFKTEMVLSFISFKVYKNNNNKAVLTIEAQSELHQ